MNIDEFVGRDAEARTILASVEHKHSSLIIAEAGMGKSALIEFISPILQSEGKLISTNRVGPFGSFIKEVFEGLWNHGLIAEQTDDMLIDQRNWGKKHKGNDEKARNLIEIIENVGDVILTVDDASSVTVTTRPWLIKFVESCTVIAAIDPSALKKAGTKRFWKLFDEVRLEPLSKLESAELLSKLIKRYRITTDDLEIYRRSVLDMAQGSPFEMHRLVKYHSSNALVKSREVISGTNVFVERDVRQLALAPIILIMGSFVVAGRYIARVQGDMDVYVLSAIGLGMLIVFSPFLRAALKPRSK